MPREPANESKRELPESPSRIVYPEDLAMDLFNGGQQPVSLRQRALLFEAYFVQRLGEDLPRTSKMEPAFPAIVVDRRFFCELLGGSYPIWARMLDESPDAWSEWFVIDSAADPESVLLSMPIEDAAVGEHSLDFLARFANHPQGELLFPVCRRLAAVCQALHRRWRERSVPFIRFDRLPKEFVNRRTRLLQVQESSVR
ncbi:hypothetical protein MAMC_00998 [Methylacidimicrobium cyclopophantes]|uniref:Uncharacterized protein n=1 Tax=Methylacidimicrobium cyclopophantes TaxID=1041766 RepID=A0A5E6MEH4_9BACT|nr:hypothetical protein [Methylacidimicrobium cyclopophantes]VVM06223.1 hypothetical protein MAMC_00998 [Methylacidimicrobium cyclopophantes]